MSVINRVLNDLEKRGASALPGDTSIRVVHARKNLGGVAWLIAAMLMLAVAGLLWSKTTTPMRVAPEPAKQVAAPQAESKAAAVAAQEIPRQENLQTGESKTAGAATHLSFELSTTPPHSGLRAKPVAAATRQNHDKAASHPPASAKGTPETGNSLSANTKGGQFTARQAGSGADTADAELASPVVASAPAAALAGSVDKQIKQISVQQRADNEFRKAVGLMQQGRTDEAVAGYGAALQLDADHDAARQALVGLLLESKRNADAERVLQDGLKHNPKQSGFAMLLARLQVERNELAPALETLQKTLPHAGQQADYQAFIAALLQRQNRHNEAISHYQIALQLSPNSGVWLMGLGISMQAAQRNEEARDAFKRAIESRALSAELKAFVEQRLKEL